MLNANNPTSAQINAQPSLGITTAPIAPRTPKTNKRILISRLLHIAIDTYQTLINHGYHQTPLTHLGMVQHLCCYQTSTAL